MSKLEELRQLLYKAIDAKDKDIVLFISRELDKEILKKVKRNSLKLNFNRKNALSL